MTRVTLLSVLFLSLPFITFSQNTKGMHVNDFKYIIGDAEKEDELLAFAQLHEFNYLLLYNLHFIHTQMFDLTDPVAAQPLTDFIAKAKNQYGILELGAVGEKAASFDKILAFNANNNQLDSIKFDVFHIEFEFWNSRLINDYYCSTYLEDNGYSCDITGAFEFFIDQMSLTKASTDTLGLKTEAYIGLLKPNQGPLIPPVADRLLVHYYRKSDVYNNGNSIYNYKKYRLQYIASDSIDMAILPVFSSRSYFMGPWLADHQMDQAFDTYMNGQNGFMEEDAEWIANIDIQGHHWYRYTELKEYAVPPPQGLQIGSDINEAASERSTDQFEEQSFQYFPSPARDYINLKSNIDTEVGLFSSNGLLLNTFPLNAHSIHKMDTQNLTNGIYVLHVKSGTKVQVFRMQVFH